MKNEITEANRRAWREAAVWHRSARPDLPARIADPGYVSLTANDLRALKRVGIEGKRVAHFCCNNGKDTISLTRLGASFAVGFDYSEPAIEEARMLQRISGAPCRFECVDVHDVDANAYGRYDLVYLNAGALVWLPEVESLFRVVTAILRPGGFCLLHEIHPVTSVLKLGIGERPADLEIAGSYFQREPLVFSEGLDYLGNRKYASSPAYYHSHSIGAVISGAAAAGLEIIGLEEYPDDVSGVLGGIENLRRLPLSYVLTARRSVTQSQVTVPVTL